MLLIGTNNGTTSTSESKPVTLQGSEYAHAVLELSKAIDHAKGLLLQ
jgi:hypothetical protein